MGRNVQKVNATKRSYGCNKIRNILCKVNYDFDILHIISHIKPCGVSSANFDR
jgi:hypothetical protein